MGNTFSVSKYYLKESKYQYLQAQRKYWNLLCFKIYLYFDVWISKFIQIYCKCIANGSCVLTSCGLSEVYKISLQAYAITKWFRKWSGVLPL